MSAILSAKNNHGRLVHLTHNYSREQLLEMRSSNSFTCPDCGSILYLKIGSIKIPHFAHRSHSDCESYSEPESSLHLQGKILLHDFFTHKHYPVELEKYLPEIRQRADLLVDGTSVIEFQCSSISAHDVLRRTASYSKIGLNATWIFGSTENHEPRIQIVRMMEYQKQMLLNHGDSKCLLILNPEKGVFYYYSNLFYISGNRWVGKISSLPVGAQTFPFASPKSLNRRDFDVLCAVFAQARDGFIRSQQFAKNRYQNPYWLLCYQLGLDRRNLPEFIGVPIRGAENILEHSVIWQMKVIHALKEGWSVQDIISSDKIRMNKSADTDLLLRILGDYSSFLQMIESRYNKIGKQNDVMFHIYCKSLRTLRK